MLITLEHGWLCGQSKTIDFAESSDFIFCLSDGYLYKKAEGKYLYRTCWIGNSIFYNEYYWTKQC
jgi:hypothetical protein